MIKIQKLCKSYEHKVIYKDLDLCFKEHSTNGIIGSSGCGKTTLLRILAGLESYDSGSLIGLEGKKIAYVFQEDRLMPWLSVYENIGYVMASFSKPKQIQQKVERLLKLLKLEGYQTFPIGKLSGGMQRRVAIARALAYEGDLVLLDEPFKGLDDELKWDVLSGMQQYLKESAPLVICVTHDRELASQFTCQMDIEKIMRTER